jgi:predicted nucleic-acid-binding protein
VKALDTNLLVRFVTRDDPAQARRAKALFDRAEERGERFYVPLVVVAEFCWVLRSAYDYPREEVLFALEQLGRMEILQFESEARVQELIRIGRGERMELPDLLIGLSAREVGCESTLTFDRRAARSTWFEKV